MSRRYFSHSSQAKRHARKVGGAVRFVASRNTPKGKYKPWKVTVYGAK